MKEWNPHYFDRDEKLDRTAGDDVRLPLNLAGIRITIHRSFPIVPLIRTRFRSLRCKIEAGIYTQTNNEYSIVYLRPFSCYRIHHILSYQSSAIELRANVKVQRSRVTRINGQK
jgi:hypothetical protein